MVRGGRGLAWQGWFGLGGCSRGGRIRRRSRCRRGAVRRALSGDRSTRPCPLRDRDLRRRCHHDSPPRPLVAPRPSSSTAQRVHAPPPGPPPYSLLARLRAALAVSARRTCWAWSSASSSRASVNAAPRARSRARPRSVPRDVAPLPAAEGGSSSSGNPVMFLLGVTAAASWLLRPIFGTRRRTSAGPRRWSPSFQTRLSRRKASSRSALST